MNTSKPYEICIEGYLPESWSDWFDGLKLEYDAEKNVTLLMNIADQASLIGILTKLQSLNLKVVFVRRSKSEK
jgi:hypothetical protein